jgi:hypothetical protein
MSKVIAHKKNRGMITGKVSKQDDLLEVRLDQLTIYAKELRQLSRTLVFLFFSNFAVAVVLGLTKEFDWLKGINMPNQDIGLIYLAVIFVVFFAGFYILYLFNNIRKKGMSLYAEITDEIDWGKKRREYIYNPPIKLRSHIRDFLLATELPFTSGGNGQAIYVLGFIIISLAAIILQVKL